MRYQQSFIAVSVVWFFTSIAAAPAPPPCSTNPYVIRGEGDFLDQLKAASGKLKHDKQTQHLGIALHHLNKDHRGEAIIDKFFARAKQYSPCDRQDKKGFPIGTGTETMSLEDSKYNDLDEFQGSIWPILLDAVRKSDMHKKNMNSIYCTQGEEENELGKLCELSALFQTVTGKPYTTMEAYRKATGEVDTLDMVLQNATKAGQVVSFWQSSADYHKIAVGYDQGQKNISYYTSDPKKQSPSDKKSVLLLDLIAKDHFQKGRGMDFNFALFPVELRPGDD